MSKPTLKTGTGTCRLRPIQLSCEYRQNPLGLGVPQPRLSESGASEPVLAPPQEETLKPAAPLPAATRVEPVRRVTPLRIRAGSILGLDISRPEPPAHDPE